MLQLPARIIVPIEGGFTYLYWNAVQPGESIIHNYVLLGNRAIDCTTG